MTGRSAMFFLCPHATTPEPLGLGPRLRAVRVADSDEDWVFQTAFNVTGWPAVVVRAGRTKAGLPIGVQLVAGPWREDLALGTAKHIEAQLGGYEAPVIPMKRSEPVI